MPNHVTTVIKASPQVVLALTHETTDIERAQHHRDEREKNARYKERTGRDWPYGIETLPDRRVDFDLVVPSPPNKETGGCSGKHENGEVCWYEWNIENWGTKWNAYESAFEPIAGDLCEVRFDTAWSHPVPVMTRLAMKFPGEPLYIQFADEDLGSNFGAYVLFFNEDGHNAFELSWTEGPGILPSETLDSLAAFDFISIPLCLDIAAPAEEGSREAQAWAHMLKYRSEIEWEDA